MIRVGIIAASDKGSRGEREDLSGPVIKELIGEIDGVVEAYAVVPDVQKELEAKMIEYADELKLDLIFTTGGTGFSPRDFTPEATLAVVDRLAPGIAEAMRLKSLKVTPKAMLSRATAGLRGRTLIVNLPGSPKAVKECLGFIMPALPHGIEIMRGEASECAGK
ncbi:MAG: MogA/MoaB family molybdenum cofactor biosynthesis protein [Bacillota bacterium]|jgi:molybdopterin adenylyltransferase